MTIEHRAAVKATHLKQVLSLAPPLWLREAVVVPLLNGVDHLEILRSATRWLSPRRFGWSRSVQGPG
ncbi:MAG: 2-dehydropantoate 2-reductase N-terminal domain-containing protein [Gaiellaceae bacterium]